MNIYAVMTYAVTSVFALEAAVPQKGFGSTKKQIVLAGIEMLVKATTNETAALASTGSNVGTNTEIATVSTLAGTFIDAVVAAMNHATANGLK